MLDFGNPHRRFNPLTGEWILVSPHRAKRPWQGTIEAPQKIESPDYDPHCHLCPGNMRSNGEMNPQYTDTFIFVNDHSAILPDIASGQSDEESLIVAKSERGLCKVICYTPSHNKTMADLPPDLTVRIIQTWKTQYEEIGKLPFISHVQIFENKGPLMGASSPHPHGQIWANESLPSGILKEDTMQRAYHSTHKRPLLLDYALLEGKKGERVISENDGFAVVIPFWATWPYETMILPKRPLSSLSDFKRSDMQSLAELLGSLTRAYDRLFSTSFPYSMGIHQSPTTKDPNDHWQFHMHFYPPLLRSATVKKYFVGYEMLAEAQRDINPEDAAKRLKEVYE